MFLYMATYCLSSTILPVVQRLNCPVVVLNLQPTPAIDYERLNALGDRPARRPKSPACWRAATDGAPS